MVIVGTATWLVADRASPALTQACVETARPLYWMARDALDPTIRGVEARANATQACLAPTLDALLSAREPPPMDLHCPRSAVEPLPRAPGS